MANKTTKICAGFYERTDGARVVEVRYFEHLRGWIAAAAWDRFLLTDPVPTKRAAISHADRMMAA